MNVTPPGPPGFITIQNADGVTVGVVDTQDKEVHTSTTVVYPDGDAIPAVEADKKARLNTEWAVAAASKADDEQEAAKAALSGTVYVVDDNYNTTTVK